MAAPHDRPPDTPAYRRYLASHPEAADLDSSQFAEHVFQNALRGLDRISKRFREEAPDQRPGTKP